MVSSEPQPDKDKIIQYLDSGILLTVSPGVVTDVLDRSKLLPFCPSVSTDGVWIWTGELKYYVEKYHVHLPDEFIEHMRELNWKVPEIEDAILEKLEL